MNLIGICPTYNRPHLIPNVLAMWEQQDCENQRHLIILDDANQFQQAESANWTLLVQSERCATLGGKFAWLAEAAISKVRHLGWQLEDSALVLFEDDDVYLPKYLAAHAATLRRSQFSAPSRVLANDDVGPGKWHSVEAIGRHHGAWAFSIPAYIAAGGYADRNQGFDLDLGARLSAVAKPANTNEAGYGPTYIYRWMTASKNGSAFGDDLLNSQPAPDGQKIQQVTPQMDAETASYYAEFAPRVRQSCCIK